jgi:hypothetical protein
MIEVLASSRTDTNRKEGLVAALVEKLGEAGTDPNDIMCSFRRPIARADHSAAAGSHTTCCLRLITTDGVLAAWLRRSRSELLLKNQQQTRWALTEMKELAPWENERLNV